MMWFLNKTLCSLGGKVLSLIVYLSAVCVVRGWTVDLSQLAEIIASPFEIVPFTEEQVAVQQKYYGDIKFVSIGLPGKKKFTMYAGYLDAADEIYHMPVRSTDVFLSSMPRSGSTLTQEMIWLLVNDLDFSKAKSISYDSRCFFLERFMYRNRLKELRGSQTLSAEQRKMLDIILETRTSPVEVLAKIPSPRFIKTHVPISLLPRDTLDTGKLVYVARDPRDVAVSLYHYLKAMSTSSGILEEVDFKSFFYTSFTTALWSGFPYMDHVKEAWELRDHPNLLFIFYEELNKDLKSTARRVAQFLDKQYSEQQLQQLADHLDFNNFQKNSANVEPFAKRVGLMESKPNNFIRKGKVGAWRDYFDEEMSAFATRWMEESLRGTDLRFPQQD